MLHIIFLHKRGIIAFVSQFSLHFQKKSIGCVSMISIFVLSMLLHRSVADRLHSIDWAIVLDQRLIWVERLANPYPEYQALVLSVSLLVVSEGLQRSDKSLQESSSQHELRSVGLILIAGVLILDVIAACYATGNIFINIFVSIIPRQRSLIIGQHSVWFWFGSLWDARKTSLA